MNLQDFIDMRHPVAETALMYIKSKPKHELYKWREEIKNSEDTVGKELVWIVSHAMAGDYDSLNSQDILALAFVMLQGER